MKEQRRICLLNDSYPPMIDGVANAVVNYAANLTRGGDYAAVVTPEVPGADDGASSWPVLRYPSIDTRKFVGYVAGYPFSPGIEQRLHDDKVELLHSHCPIASTFFARALREKLDAPLVLTYHTKFDVDIANALRGRHIQEEAVRLLVRNIEACDEVWTVSRGAGENLRSLGYAGDYIVMENGVDLPRGRLTAQEVAAVTGAWDLPDSVPVFLFVGRLMWYKGLRLILDALSRLAAQGRDFRMVFIGGGGDEDAVRAAAKPLGGRCVFTGPLHDREALRAWYCRSDLFLFPSTFDTNGLVVREAAACGLASVLIGGSCAAEGVTDGGNGFLIEESAESLAALLNGLYDRPGTARQVGERAGEELYLSWADAVARARQRYAVVIDRYRSGQYPPHNRLTDEVFRTQGELMARFARMEEFGGEVEQRIRSDREELRRLGSEMKEELRGLRENLRR